MRELSRGCVVAPGSRRSAASRASEGLPEKRRPPGKAGGYADAGTTVRKVGERVGVNRP
jgi:hypothetical protein